MTRTKRQRCANERSETENWGIPIGRWSGKKSGKILVVQQQINESKIGNYLPNR